MANIFDMADTWNDAGTTFTAIKMDVTNTASAAASKLLDLLIGGVSQFSIGKSGDITGPPNATLFIKGGPSDARTISLQTSAGVGIGSTDVLLFRDGANILAQRNGVNAQAFRLYNTYTDASNYERLSVGWSGNVLILATEAAGTGATRALTIRGGALNLESRFGNPLGISTNGTSRWSFDGAAGHFLAAADNTYDIGASGATRPRTGYFGTSVVAPYLALSDGIAAPSAGTGVGRLYIDTADGDLKIIFADGTIKTIATDS